MNVYLVFEVNTDELPCIKKQLDEAGITYQLQDEWSALPKVAIRITMETNLDIVAVVERVRGDARELVECRQ